jgi:hypothetical protein
MSTILTALAHDHSLEIVFITPLHAAVIVSAIQGIFNIFSTKVFTTPCGNILFSHDSNSAFLFSKNVSALSMSAYLLFNSDILSTPHFLALSSISVFMSVLNPLRSSADNVFHLSFPLSVNNLL